MAPLIASMRSVLGLIRMIAITGLLPQFVELGFHQARG